MKNKTVKVSTILVFCLFLMLLAIFWPKKNSSYTFYNIPIDKLNWGMSEEDIIALMGNPTSVAEDEYGVALIYDGQMESKLGSCSSMTLYVGYTGQQWIPSGLGIIDMTLDNTTLETIIDHLNTIYGDLTEKSTQLELSLKKANSNYFDKLYFSENWKMNSLSEEEYRLLEDFAQKSMETKSIQVNLDTPLMTINVSGVRTEETYTCNISFNAYTLSCLMFCSESK